MSQNSSLNERFAEKLSWGTETSGPTMVGEVLAVFVVEEDRGAIDDATEPCGDDVNEFKVVDHKHIASSNVPKGMERIEKPGAGNTNLRSVKIGGKELRKSSKGGGDSRQPFRCATSHRFWWGGEDK